MDTAFLILLNNMHTINAIKNILTVYKYIAIVEHI